MNKQEKPILYNSSIEKLIISINEEKPPNGSLFCCLNCGWYFIKVACAFFLKSCSNDIVMGNCAVKKVKNRNTKRLFLE